MSVGLDVKVIVVLIIIIIISNIKKKSRRNYESGGWMDILDIKDKKEKGRQGEHYIAELLKDLGFKDVQITQASADGGKDVIARKNGKLYYVEVKFWRYNPKDWRTKVGQDVMRSVFGAANDSGNREKTYPMVVTTSYFSDKAIAYAKRNNITLVDQDELMKLEQKRDKMNQKGLGLFRWK